MTDPDLIEQAERSAAIRATVPREELLREINARVRDGRLVLSTDRDLRIKEIAAAAFQVMSERFLAEMGKAQA